MISKDTNMHTMPMKELSALRYVDDAPGLRGEAGRIYGERWNKATPFKVWTGPVGIEEYESAIEKIPGVFEVCAGTEWVHFRYEGTLEEFKAVVEKERVAAQQYHAACSLVSVLTNSPMFPIMQRR